jgi:predicted aminopeptidase
LSKLLALLLLVPLLAGCETLSYYLQAADGQLGLLTQARSVESLVADPATPAALRDRLEVAASIRRFATEELKLPDNASYRRYTDLARTYAVWNVVAAPEFALEPLHSCFPITGCVPYRGYFAEDDARARGEALRAAGNDVLVYGVPAYSTLGWFDDPLLSTFIRYPDAELARLIFHELAHQVVYVKGDATFNESFAVAVEREGVRRWLAATGREGQLQAFLKARERAEQFTALIREARDRLSVVYQGPLTLDAKREQKRAEFARLAARYAELKASWGGYAGYDRFFADGSSNALLASFQTYSGLVPAFERLLAAQGGDMRRFYDEVAALGRLDDQRRSDALGRAAGIAARY